MGTLPQQGLMLFSGSLGGSGSKVLGKDPSLENALTELQRALDPVPADLEITQAPKPVGIGFGASALGLHPGALQRQAGRGRRYHQHQPVGRFGVAQARLFPPEAVGLVIEEVFLDAEALPAFLEGLRAGGSLPAIIQVSRSPLGLAKAR